ncbi:auxin-responsive protein IAA10 [Hordeum vulgare]|nr:auxin-responsive protein IAA10 [Hordeum vulgare]
MRGPTAAAAFGPGEPPPDTEEVVEENSGGEEELELGLCLGSKKLLQLPVAPSPCRILTARDLHPAAALSPDSSVSSSSPAAAKPEDGPAPAASPGTLASGHPQSSFGVVGWPPIRTFRMNSLFGQAKDNASEAETKKAAADDSGSQKDKEETEKKGRVPGWVKVNMDGEVIGRKVDLNAHRSYKTLALALEIMFTKPSAGLCASNATKSLKLLDNSSEYQMTYEDRDGDWMLVGDVPWEMFVGSVKRLRIMRTSDASGLG